MALLASVIISDKVDRRSASKHIMDETRYSNDNSAMAEGKQEIGKTEIRWEDGQRLLAGYNEDEEETAWSQFSELEPFERGAYAAPIGWIDSAGDAELRVAIRSGVLRGSRLELTAGAGLVKGSVPERELQEVALKLEVLQQQLTVSPAVNAAG